MIIELLKLLVAIVIFLAVVIAAGLGYSRYQKGGRNELEDTSPIEVGREVGFGEPADSKTSGESRQMIVRSYGQVRNILVFKASLGGRKELTEREIVDAIRTVPHLRMVSEKLERSYKTYEQVRFGSHQISEEEFETFLRELREVSARIQ